MDDTCCYFISAKNKRIVLEKVDTHTRYVKVMSSYKCSEKKDISLVSNTKVQLNALYSYTEQRYSSPTTIECDHSSYDELNLFSFQPTVFKSSNDIKEK